MKIGSKLKYIRESILKLNQVEMAEKFNQKSKAVIWNWENDVSKPSLEILFEITREAGLNLEYFQQPESSPVIKEPPEEYKVKRLEEENAELKEENDRLRTFNERAAELLAQAKMSPKGKRRKF